MKNKKEAGRQQCVAVHCGQKPATSATQTVTGNWQKRKSQYSKIQQPINSKIKMIKSMKKEKISYSFHLKILIVFMLFFFGSNLFAQKVKKVKNKVESPYTYFEKYKALKSDLNIRHGEYTKKSIGMLIESGQYNTNKKSGTWTVYESKNSIYYKFDYDSNTFKYINPKIEGVSTDYNTNRPAILIKGSSDLLRLIYRNLKYPKTAMENGIEGKVIMELSISKNGEISKISVKDSPNELLTEAAIKLIETHKDYIDFFPALTDGEKVESTFSFPIIYKL